MTRRCSRSLFTPVPAAMLPPVPCPLTALSLSFYRYGLSGEHVIPQWSGAKTRVANARRAEALRLERVTAVEHHKRLAREAARRKAVLDPQLVGAPIDETALEFMDIVALWRLAGLKSGITKADLRFFQVRRLRGAVLCRARRPGAHRRLCHDAWTRQTTKKPSSLVLMAAQALRITLCPSLSLPAPADLRWPNLNAWMLATREVLKAVGRTEYFMFSSATKRAAMQIFFDNPRFTSDTMWEASHHAGRVTDWIFALKVRSCDRHVRPLAHPRR